MDSAYYRRVLYSCLRKQLIDILEEPTKQIPLCVCYGNGCALEDVKSIDKVSVLITCSDYEWTVKETWLGNIERSSAQFTDVEKLIKHLEQSYPLGSGCMCDITEDEDDETE